MSENGDQPKAAPNRRERRGVTEPVNARLVSTIPNAVHADHHWRQRLIKERASAADWKESWGFLEAEKPVTATGAGIQALIETGGSVEGPMHHFLTAVNRNPDLDMTSGRTKSPRTPTANGTSRRATFSPASPSVGAAGSATARSPRAVTPLTPRSAAARVQAAALKNSDVKTRAVANVAMNAAARLQNKYNSSSSNYSSDQVVPGLNSKIQPIQPTLHLDAELANTLRPVQLQPIGASSLTRGVDPVLKYRFPQTAAQQIGWQTAQRVRLMQEANGQSGGQTAAAADTLTGHLSSLASTSLSTSMRQTARAQSFSAAAASTGTGVGVGGGGATGKGSAPPAPDSPTKPFIVAERSGGGAAGRAGLLTPTVATIYSKQALQSGVAHPSGAMDKTEFWRFGIKNHNSTFWS